MAELSFNEAVLRAAKPMSHAEKEPVGQNDH